MPACRCLLFALSVWLALGSPAFAGAPALEETCRQRGVLTIENGSQRFFAEVVPPRTSAPRGGSPYVISINPERTFLGRETQQWLYLRQCAHIVEKHKIVESGERGLNIRDEEDADCWAVREMMRSKAASFTPRSLHAIERDMDRVLREERWRQVLPGPQRRISLSACIGK